MTAFKAAAAAKPGLTAARQSPVRRQLYVAVPEYAPELLDFQSWGLDVIDPETPGPGLPVLGEPELGEGRQVPARPAPVRRPQLPAATLETLEEQPTLDSIKAVQGRRVHDVAGVLAAHVRRLRRRSSTQLTDGDQRGRPGHRRLSTAVTATPDPSRAARAGRGEPAPVGLGLAVLAVVLAPRLLPQHHDGLARDHAWPTIWTALTDLDTGVRVARRSSARCACRARCSASSSAPRSGLAGAILQGVTRNPLADPGILGINAGAAAARGPRRSRCSASRGARRLRLVRLRRRRRWRRSLVYAIASLGREGATPVKLALAGAAVTAGLTSVTTGDRDDQRRRARRAAVLAGRLARRPVHARSSGRRCRSSLVGIVVALGCGRALNGLALGEDVARGARPARAR